MILLGGPYVSDLLLDTIGDNALPFRVCDPDLDLPDGDAPPTGDRFLTNSENTYAWVAAHLGHTDLPAKVDVFKDKARFRRLVQPLFPDFFFREIGVGELDELDVSELPSPFVIKPNVGFFSLGVHKVDGPAHWPVVRQKIADDLAHIGSLYPPEVLDTATFLIEDCIAGDEFAVDAYFDGTGEVVILNILQHLFSSEADVSDRVYLSSRDILQRHLQPFSDFLAQVGERAGLRNFPLHVELRVDSNGTLAPIEVNPLRFGGWCTTADLTAMAYGVNPYLYFLQDRRPDWAEVFAGREDTLFSVIVLDNSTGVPGKDIGGFDYEALRARFHKPLALRKADFRRFPLFGFIFAETDPAHREELDFILTSDLREFLLPR